MRRRLFGAAALVALIGAPFFATETACFPQSACDGSTDNYCTALGDGGVTPGCGGQLLDDGLTWASGPIEGAWLTFPRERVWHIDPRDATGKKLRGRITGLEVSISATQNHVQAAPAAGNNAQWKYYPGDQTFDVQNDTCQDYFAYVTIHASVDADASTITTPDAAPDTGIDP